MAEIVVPDRQPVYRSVRFRQDRHEELDALATELSEERGGVVSVPAAVLEAVRFFQANRKKDES